MENRERIFELFDIYQSLLTKAQRDAIESHYAYDLSFGEISKEQSISRAGVNEAVKSAIAKMEEYEAKLHLIDQKNKLKKISKSKDPKKELDKYLEETYGI